MKSKFSYHILVAFSLFSVFLKPTYSQVAEWLLAEDGMSARVCTDNLGNSFTAGQFVGTVSVGSFSFTSVGLQDVVVAKRNPNGQVLWAMSFGGTQADYVYDLGFDNDGYLWLTGVFAGSITIGSYTLTSQGSNDVFVVKLNAASGAVEYAVRCGGTGNDSGLGLEVTPSGFVYISGIFVGNFNFGTFTLSGPSYEIYLLKLNSSGSLVWGTSISGPGIESMWSITSDADENVFVCGLSTSASATFAGNSQALQGNNHFIAGFNAAGQFLWAALSYFNGEIYAACTDAAGNIYFTGNFDTQASFGNIQLNAAGSDDLILGKINPSGVYEWVQSLGGTGHEDGKDVICTSNGSLYLAGVFQGNITLGGMPLSSGSSMRGFVAKFSPDGTIQWAIQNSGGTGSHLFHALAAYGQSLYLTASSSGTLSFGGLSVNTSTGFLAKLNTQANIVAGQIFLDQNANGLIDTLEIGLPNILVHATANPWLNTVSGGGGHYQLAVGTGNHNVTIPNLPLYYTQTTPAVLNASFSGMGSYAAGFNFGLAPAGSINDLRIDVTPVTLAKPGFVYVVMITCRNVGTTTLNAQASLQIPAYVNFLNAAPVPSSYSGQTLSWSLGAMAPMDLVSLFVHFQVPPSAPIGMPVTLTATIQPQAGDQTPSDNTFTLQNTVVGPYDPNYKTVDIDTLWSVDPVRDLTYTIHFQNVGNAPAHTVLLRDTLSAYLDPSSIEIISSSHQPMQWTYHNGHVLEFRFDGIMLPDSASDPLGSCGFVKFKIKHRNTLPLNESIYNFADIYFDYNPPIRTNSVATIYAQKLTGLETTAGIMNYLNIYPNPADEFLIINENIGISDNAILNIYDAWGRRVEARRLTGVSNGIPVALYCGHLAPGLYVVEYREGERVYRARFIRR
jgi:hypothetical protein